MANTQVHIPTCVPDLKNLPTFYPAALRTRVPQPEGAFGNANETMLPVLNTFQNVLV